MKGPPPLDYRPPHAPYLSIAHLDEHAIVVDKPSGLLSVPGKTPDLADCVEARAREVFPEALIVHRLDMDTSGLILLARSKRALAPNRHSAAATRKISPPLIAATMSAARGAGQG
ncbi:MAG: pseudouridine synthase, partial [Pseudomonadota bacterium]